MEVSDETAKLVVKDQKPQCFIGHEGNVVIVIKGTPSTVYCIEAIDMQHQISSYRTVEFHKTFKAIDYDVAKAAEKMLNRAQYTFTNGAIQELKEIIMNNSTIIAVNPAAEFVGKFASIEAIVATCPSDTIIISSVEDLDGFTKNQLAECLGLASSNLKNTTKAQLAEQLYAEYLTKEVEIVSPKGSEQKASRGGSGLIHKLHKALSDGAVVCEEFIEANGTTEKVFSSVCSNIQNEKYSSGLMPIKLAKGTIGGKTAIAIMGQEPENFERRSKMAKEKGEKVERNGIRKQLRAFFAEGGSGTKKEIAEKFGVDLKIISDNICYLKNPKFAGVEGPMNLVTDKESKVVSLG